MAWGKRKDGQAYNKDKPKGISGSKMDTKPTGDVHLKSSSMNDKREKMRTDSYGKKVPAIVDELRQNGFEAEEGYWHIPDEIDKEYFAGKTAILRFKTPVDESPDLSWLEEPQTHAGDKYIDYKTGKEKVVSKATADKYAEQDKERLAGYGDQWHMIGVLAEARINNNGVTDTIESGGLWGIESDSDHAYIEDTKRDQMIEIIDQLKKMGIKKVYIDRKDEEYN